MPRESTNWCACSADEWEKCLFKYTRVHAASAWVPYINIFLVKKPGEGFCWRGICRCETVHGSYCLCVLQRWGNPPWPWPAAAGWSGHNGPCHSWAEIMRNTKKLGLEFISRPKFKRATLITHEARPLVPIYSVSYVIILVMSSAHLMQTAGHIILSKSRHKKVNEAVRLYVAPLSSPAMVPSADN